MLYVCNQEAQGVAGSPPPPPKKKAKKVKESKIPLLSLMLNSSEIFIKFVAYTCSLKPVNT